MVAAAVRRSPPCSLSRPPQAVERCPTYSVRVACSTDQPAGQTIPATHHRVRSVLTTAVVLIVGAAIQTRMDAEEPTGRSAAPVRLMTAAALTTVATVIKPAVVVNTDAAAT